MKQVENLIVGRMNRRHNGQWLRAARQPTQTLHDQEGGVTVQPGGGLIDEQQLRWTAASHQLLCNRNTLLLAAAALLEAPRKNLIVEHQLLQHLLDMLPHLGRGAKRAVLETISIG